MGRAARDWAEIQEPMVAPLYTSALKFLEPPDGKRLRDAGCGSEQVVSDVGGIFAERYRLKNHALKRGECAAICRTGTFTHRKTIPIMKRILLLLALLPTLSWADGLPTTPYIYVQGSATMNVMPDMLTLSFSLSCTDPDQAKAKLAVSEQSSAVLKLLKELGVPDQAVIAQSLQSSAKYDYRGGKNDFLGYVVQRTFKVTFTEFDLYPRLLDGLFALHVASVQDVRPSFSKDTEASAKLKSAALVDAKKQADSIAAEMGASVVSVFSVSPVPPGSIRGTILGADGYAFTPGLRAGFETPDSSLTAAGDRFSFDQIKLAEWIHVIFLIEPVKK